MHVVAGRFVGEQDAGQLLAFLGVYARPEFQLRSSQFWISS